MRACWRIPAIFSTFRANRSSSSACCRPRPRSRTASSRVLRHFDCTVHRSMSSSTGRRRAGLLIPLFSCPSAGSWGIGDIGDIAAAHRAGWPPPASGFCSCFRSTRWRPASSRRTRRSARWRSIRFSSACRALPSSSSSAARRRWPPAIATTLRAVRASPRVEFQAVRGLKQRALRASFERFLEHEWRSGSERDRALQAYVSEQAWWLEDYALFRALHAREHERAWTEWPEALQRREPTAIDRARRELADEVLFQQYLQWLAGTQWQEARADTHGVALFGDLPFMVDADSADVWVRQHQFRLDMSVGAPPDAFSATGQDWGMPVYQWDALATEDYRGCASARGAAPICSTATASITWSVSIEPTARPQDDGGAAGSSRRPTNPRSARSAKPCSSCSAAPARRSSPRISAPCPTSSAPRWRVLASRLSRVPLGAALAQRRAAVPRSGGVSARVGGRVRHARHRAGRRSGGSTRPTRNDRGQRICRRCSA